MKWEGAPLTPDQEAAWKASLKCSFCGKSFRQVENVVAGPNVAICNECVDLAVEILADERASRGGSGK